jgi:hypothetical protein
VGPYRAVARSAPAGPAAGLEAAGLTHHEPEPGMVADLGACTVSRHRYPPASFSQTDT